MRVGARKCFARLTRETYLSPQEPMNQEQNGRGGGSRTPDLRFWRPSLYQLSYTPSRDRPAVPTGPAPDSPSTPLMQGVRTNRLPGRFLCPASGNPSYSMMEATTPAPTVRPPSRMAKRRPSSMAIGTISSTSTETLSPGMTISVPSGSDTTPVTSVVRK
jgi:hypothetical protein